MTQATKKLLEAFEALPDQKRSELVAELARRTPPAPQDSPSDQDLLAATDQLLLDLDKREQS